MNIAKRESSVCALLIGSYEADRLLVHDIFRTLGWRLHEARNRRHAQQALQRNQVHVVIAEEEFAWNWKDLLRGLSRLDPAPQLIVASRTADDRFWAEALNVGAYDVLRRPFERDEVERVVASAWRHFQPAPRALWIPRTVTGIA
jgi:response regulator RpfG family c-di-GMP phosphodiesterase